MESSDPLDGEDSHDESGRDVNDGRIVAISSDRARVGHVRLSMQLVFSANTRNWETI